MWLWGQRVTSAVQEHEHWTRLTAEGDTERGSDADTLTAAHVGILLDALAPVLTPGACVLDIGCGIGRLTLELARRCPDVTVAGVDIAQTAIHAAVEQARTAQLTNTDFYYCDGRTLPHLAPLAAVYSVRCFQHLDARTVRNFLVQSHRMLAPGGLVVFQYVPHREGDTDEPFAHTHRLEDLLVTVSDLSLVGAVGDEQFPEWEWVTLRKMEAYA